MTTFKNNSKYAELIYIYLDVAYSGKTPLTVQEVLCTFKWSFKGGSLKEASSATRLRPLTSSDEYPTGLSEAVAAEWPSGRQAIALRRILHNRAKAGKLKSRALLGRLGTYMLMTSELGSLEPPHAVFSGLRAVYLLFGRVWDWALGARAPREWDVLEHYMREVVLGACAPSKVDIPTAEEHRAELWRRLSSTRVPGLLQAIFQVKEVLLKAGSREAYAQARSMGEQEANKWSVELVPGLPHNLKLSPLGGAARFITVQVGPCRVLVSQECALVGAGRERLGLARSDLERLHQLLMSSASALLGVVAQAVVGTYDQRSRATLAVEVADKNIARIVRSSRLCPLGEEVLVCKGYRRAYTAHLGWLSGEMCREETLELVEEAKKTAPEGVLDVEGFLHDLRALDAASSLNAAKMFKVCPAPDVSPGTAMMDRITQVGNGNVPDLTLLKEFESELRSQVLRAHIRCPGPRLKVRVGMTAPTWINSYREGDFDSVPSSEIDTYLQWEGTGVMPDISPFDPSHWKDSGLGADTIKDSQEKPYLGKKGNMITRLVFDEGCPMPGRQLLNDEHVIKFFMKAEGHKDPARGIFSSNLTDRQAQSWMEKAVEKVALHHPSFMIGQTVDVKESKVLQLTTPPAKSDWVALYYSFDISGWSAKMPAEPQRISHSLWGDLYGGHLFRRATEINEGAHIYLNMEGYMGWFRNTHANLEGFNGKEMTMVLIALLSLSVRQWRKNVVEEGIMQDAEAKQVTALLFAYIDDGLSRIDLPRSHAKASFECYKRTVIETFMRCGFSVEVSKCFPSDRFAIFLNEVYLAGRHVVHGVRAAMAISSEPTEKHTTLIERVTSVSTGCRGAVMSGLNPLSAVFLMSYHVFMHILEWTNERDPVVLAVWSMCPRSWGGLGMPNLMQLFVSGSGAAFEEGVATLQKYAMLNPAAKKFFIRMCRTEMRERTATGVLTAPLSCRVDEGYMIDNRVGGYVRKALAELMGMGELSTYAKRLLAHANNKSFYDFAEAVVPLGETEVIQEQMLDNVASSHPHRIFAAFARRLEKSQTVKTILRYHSFRTLLQTNRREAEESVRVMRSRMMC